MQRRGFLKAVVGSVTAAGLLIKARPDEVQLLGVKANKSVIVQPELITQPRTGIWSYADPSEVLYNARGEAVAIIEEIEMNADPMHEITTFRDANREFISAPRELKIMIRARGISLKLLED